MERSYKYVVCFMCCMLSVCEATWFSPVYTNCADLMSTDQPLMVLYLDEPPNYALRLWFNKHAEDLPSFGIQTAVYRQSYWDVGEWTCCHDPGVTTNCKGTGIVLYEGKQPVKTLFPPMDMSPSNIWNYFMDGKTTSVYRYRVPKGGHDSLSFEYQKHLQGAPIWWSSVKTWYIAVIPFDEHYQERVITYRNYAEKTKEVGEIYLFTKLSYDLETNGPLLFRLGHVKPHMGFATIPTIYRVDRAGDSHLIKEIPWKDIV